MCGDAVGLRRMGAGEVSKGDRNASRDAAVLMSEIACFRQLITLAVQFSRMLKEFQGALRGVKQSLALHHRASMTLVAFAFIYLVLWILHLLYVARSYVLLVLVLILSQVIGVKAAMLIRMAVLSPPKNSIGPQ